MFVFDPTASAIEPQKFFNLQNKGEIEGKKRVRYSQQEVFHFKQISAPLSSPAPVEMKEAWQAAVCKFREWRKADKKVQKTLSFFSLYTHRSLLY